MYTTQKLYSDAVGVVPETACRRFKNIPIALSGAYGTRHYLLTRVLPTLRARDFDAVERLVANSIQPDDTLYVGPPEESLTVAAALIEWLPERMRPRLQAAQHAFLAGVGNSKLCSPSIVENLGPLQMLLILQPDILRHVLTSSPRPDMSRLSPAFALVNNTANLFIKDAA